MTKPKPLASHVNDIVDEKIFARRFRTLLLLAWALPPLIGLPFLVFLQIFTGPQVLRILFSLLMVVFLTATLAFTDWYFKRYVHPFRDLLTRGTPADTALAEQRARGFPLAFWAVFLGYLLVAPFVVIVSAQMHVGFEPTPLDWFRIHLVALIVTIIVGLPIFFRFLDLFGRALSRTPLLRPHVTLRTKVFLIGTLTPLLIDTMLVQYYWTRTGFFTMETFLVWVFLEMLAIAGSLMFVRSFGQALQPLHGIVSGKHFTELDYRSLAPQSTDELGVITGRFHALLEELRLHNIILETSNRILHNISLSNSKECFSVLGDTCAKAIGDDQCYLFLLEEGAEELMCVAYTGMSFNAKGHFRLALNTPSPIAQAFKTRKTQIYSEEYHDPRVHAPLLPMIMPQAAVLTPLSAENDMLGVLMSVNTTTRRQYSESDIRLIEGLAREAALVIKTRLLLSQRQQAEERFKQLNELAQVTLESIGEGVITTDTAGSVIYMNPMAELLSGWKLADGRGKFLQEVFQLRDETTRVDAPLEYYDHLTRNEQSRYSLLAHRDRIKESHVEISSTPLKNSKRQVIGAVLVLRDVSEIRRLIHKMSYQTSHDALTGLLNRREFENCLETALHARHAQGISYVVCYIDLDQFKVINDTCGHTAGDELVKQLAGKLSAALGDQDILARLGGDEFGILLPHCTVQRGTEVAGHLLEVVKALRFTWNEKTFNLAASIGVVPIAERFTQITDVLRAADSACYVAKEHGRNRIHIFHDNDLALATHHGQMQWMHKIQRALGENQFQLYVQPIVALVDGGKKLFQCEILVRMLDSAGQPVTPANFLPSAERYHLMPAIDRWVVKNFLAWLKDRTEYELNSPYFINLSGQSLSDSHFLDFVVEEINNSRIPTHMIGFEITETAAVQNVTKAMHFITTLKAMGCRFSLDDFGSGVSSFTYLKNLPVDYLKIDGSFVWDMENDQINTAMVESINQIGHMMGIQTIAECVENGATLDALKRLGVDYVQGYHLGVPRPLH